MDPEVMFKEAKKMRKMSMLARKETSWYTYIESLEDFRVIDFLGRGTFGDVFLAQSTSTKLAVALKCLDKDALITGRQHHFVKREIAALQIMNHPFIVKFYNVFTSSRKVFLAMEYIKGLELWTYMLKFAGAGPYGGLPIAQATLYAATLLLALEHIHAQGYIYRDLKVRPAHASSNM